MASPRRPGRPRREGGPDPVRSFRAGAHYEQARDLLAQSSLDVSSLINAFLRWLNNDPEAALAALAPYLRPKA
jgi:hypothetical protein